MTSMRLLSLFCVLSTSLGFMVAPPSSQPSVVLRAEQSKWESEEPFQRSNLDKFLSTKYPEFYAVLSQNEEVDKVLNADGAITVFAPNSQAFANLEDKRRAQLGDPRNLETVEKIAAFHVVSGEVVPATRLFQEDWTVPKTLKGNPQLSFQGVLSMGGEIAVSRSKSGGFLGLFKEEDGGVIIGPEAKIVQSFNVGGAKGAVVHEVDALVSPELLWRFADQLRIPGF
mmetsp:Transcript_11434/g.19001  ORF Transcript_11434/g.19001 Transcript_11434/m.19001 type:complete len:227 (-) Transcript_11434:84-764(-)|eukprot:CAMPEP_0119012472 /NCGR_PEP_ID=MMETSP1176-20130426/6749_1 /TAXON_ID=265551 /ORGANISM="Synedropsis recta cf, Strain CCMP1620" /LENGTH=226 /DNA_ID=CAMNT_0006965437 /DNA_START=58 /DNA_END=738 /DNA_ORIENTATION=+